MPRRPPPPARLRAVVVAAVLTATVAGCSGDSDDAADGGATTPATSSPTTPTTDEPTTDATDGPSTDPTESTPTSDSPTTTEPAGSSPRRAKQAQIPAADLPGFNSAWVWEHQSSGPGPGQDVASVCQQASLTAIGAVAEYRTDFSSPLSAQSTAVQMTAVFPDEQTLGTAVQVLQAWQRKCQDHATKALRLKQVKVGDITTTSTSAGQGQQWLTTYKPVAGAPDDAWFQANGFVTDGDTLTFLVMTTPGQDYNYAAGKAPIDLALRTAADRLVATR